MNTDFFKFISERTVPEGPKIISSNGLWSFSSKLTAVTFFEGKSELDFSLTDFRMSSTSDKIINAGFIETKKKLFIFSFRNNNPILYLLFSDTNKPRYFSLILSSLHFHNNVYNVFSPFPNSFCIISREGISIHNPEDLSVIYEKQMNISSFCFHENIVALNNKKTLYFFQFTSKDNCRQLHKRKQVSPVLVPKQILLCKNGAFLMSAQNSNKMSIKYIQMQPFNSSDRNIDAVLSANYKYDDLTFSLFDQALLVSSPSETVLVDVLGTQPVSFGQIPNKPSAQIVNNSLLFSNNTLYEFEENYNSYSDPCPLDLIAAILRRSNGIETAMNKLSKILKNCKAYNVIDDIVWKVGSYALSPLAQLRFTRTLLYSGITNPHLILLGLLRYSHIIGARLTDDAKRPLYDMLAKDEIIECVPALLSAWNQKLDRNAMGVLIRANPAFYDLDPTFFQNSLDLIRACMESGRQERARLLIIRATTNGEGGEELATIIEQYIAKYGDNIERSFRQLGRCVSTKDG